MTAPDTAQVLTLLVESLEAERAWKQAGMGDESTARRLLYAQQAIQALDPAHLRQFAQAHADQQARLRALVGAWRDKSATDGLFIDVAFPGDAVGRIANQQRNRCADELEAVLGGKE